MNAKNIGINSLQPVLLLLITLFLILLLPYRAGSEVIVAPETIRVGLAQDVQEQEFFVQGKYRLVNQQTGDLLHDVLPGERWRVIFLSNGIQIYKNGQQVGTCSGNLGLRQINTTVAIMGGSGNLKNVAVGENMSVAYAGGQATSLKVDGGKTAMISQTGTSLVQGGDLNLVSLVTGSQSPSYRGNFEFRPQNGGITVINELPLDEYLYGVIPREMPAFWPIEAQKAQAVTARSYALAQLGTYKAYGFDLLNTQLSQVYGGYTGEHPNAGRAVDETRGQVLTCKGKVINAFFHSSSGGYTENSEDVWVQPLEFIRARPDPYDRNDKHYNWEVIYDQEQLISQLVKRKNYYSSTSEPDKVFSRVDDINILEKTSSGLRIKKIRIKGLDAVGQPLQVEISNADAVRTTLGLKSSLFEMKKEIIDGVLSTVTLKGSGYGHGLGMSQYGALGMANQGYNYQDILKYYYNNSQISQVGR